MMNSNIENNLNYKKENTFSQKIIIVGIIYIMFFIFFAMTLGYLSEFDGDDIPDIVVTLLGFFLEEDYFPSLTEIEQNLKYTHLHFGVMGIMCSLCGLISG